MTTNTENKRKPDYIVYAVEDIKITRIGVGYSHTKGNGVNLTIFDIQNLKASLRVSPVTHKSEGA